MGGGRGKRKFFMNIKNSVSFSFVCSPYGGDSLWFIWKKNRREGGGNFNFELFNYKFIWLCFNIL